MPLQPQPWHTQNATDLLANRIAPLSIQSPEATTCTVPLTGSHFRSFPFDDMLISESPRPTRFLRTLAMRWTTHARRDMRVIDSRESPTPSESVTVPGTTSRDQARQGTRHAAQGGQGGARSAGPPVSGRAADFFHIALVCGAPRSYVFSSPIGLVFAVFDYLCVLCFLCCNDRSSREHSHTWREGQRQYSRDGIHDRRVDKAVLRAHDVCMHGTSAVSYCSPSLLACWCARACPMPTRSTERGAVSVTRAAYKNFLRLEVSHTRAEMSAKPGMAPSAAPA